MRGGASEALRRRRGAEGSPEADDAGVLRSDPRHHIGEGDTLAVIIGVVGDAQQV